VKEQNLARKSKLNVRRRQAEVKGNLLRWARRHCLLMCRPFKALSVTDVENLSQRQMLKLDDKQTFQCINSCFSWAFSLHLALWSNCNPQHFIKYTKLFIFYVFCGHKRATPLTDERLSTSSDDLIA